MSVRITNRLGKERKRELAEYEASMVDFKIGTISGNLKALIADEKLEFKAGDIKPIKIKKVNLPANHICYMCAYATNQVGHTIAAGEETPLPISMDRHADHAAFAAAQDGTVEKNDLIGVVILLPVHPTHL
ncbi:MAG TPA: DUF22 domain-containing protein [Methanobacteriaceae archaeon]|nr:DUF22 domain-containing protein [Methanobacteriaceae archaeon]